MGVVGVIVREQHGIDLGDPGGDQLQTEFRRRVDEQAGAEAGLLRQLGYHAALARQASNGERLVELLGIRDLMMADTLAYIAQCERGRGKVLVFAHNSHLKSGQAKWQLGPDMLAWWPAGAHIRERLGSRYAVIGTAVAESESESNRLAYYKVTVRNQKDDVVALFRGTAYKTKNEHASAKAPTPAEKADGGEKGEARTDKAEKPAK